jgi:3-oxoacyl-[acyl-carrier-protein] synthase-3
MNMYSRILGTGSHLPPRRLSNADLAAELALKGVETSDEWIVERTGIRARHFAAPDVGCSDLAVHAARQALQAAGLQASDLDLIIVATSTPDMVFPSTATMVQHKLGTAGCPAFDVQAVCSGFVYALTVADAMIRSGAARQALVIGAEVFSRILDFSDRTTCVLFGDGAGAVVLGAADQPGILPTFMPMGATVTSCVCPDMCPAVRCWATPCSRWMARPCSSWRWAYSRRRPAPAWPKPACRTPISTG